MFDKLHKDNINQWLAIQIPAGGCLDLDAEKVMMHQIRLGNLGVHIQRDVDEEILAEGFAEMVEVDNTDYVLDYFYAPGLAQKYINKITNQKNRLMN